jgi:hypothetical protein
LLPSRLANLAAAPLEPPTPLPEHVKTIADCVIQATEDEINSHLTASSSMPDSQINPANSLAAVRRLRMALKPFVSGWVDTETADLVPADLDDKLAARAQELAQMRLPSARQRKLGALCQRIEVWVRHWSSANSVTVSEQELRYIDAGLNFAGIQHPDLVKTSRPARRARFPENLASPVEGAFCPSMWDSAFAILRSLSWRNKWPLVPKLLAAHSAATLFGCDRKILNRWR